MKRCDAFWLLGAVLVLAVVAWVSVVMPRPRGVLPADADPKEFSGARAYALLDRLLDGDRPHPMGSAANREFRERLERELVKLGLTPKVVSGTACGQFGICGRVDNVVAELEGTVREPAVALVAHYDSVVAGPGAADDGSGVASLVEAARALRASGPLPRSVWLVFTDGEEMGLLGARQLVTDREFLRRLGVVINLDARGVSGPSLMFETTGANDGLIAAFQRGVSRPVTSSAFYAVYKRMPNDTDLTVFRNANVPGLNFAFIGGTTRYHTPQDDLAHLSRETLQHQGEQALAMAREFARNGVPKLEHETVFFDVLGQKVVAVSVPTFRWIALVCVFLGVFAFARTLGASARGRRQAAWAAFACVLSLLGAAALGGVLAAALGARGALDQPWPAHGALILGGSCLAALSALSLVTLWLGARFDRSAAVHGTCLFELALTGLLAWSLPEAGYLFALPAFASMLAASAGSAFGERAGRIAALASLAVNTLLWAPILALTFDALGVAVAALPAALAAILGVRLPPFLLPTTPSVRRRVAIATGAGTLLAWGACLFGDGRSDVAPARVSVAHHSNAETGTARWLLDSRRVPPEFATVAAFAPLIDDDFPWFGGGLVATFQASAPQEQRPAPRVELVRETATDAGRVLELSLTPGDRNALAIEIAFAPQAVSRIAVDGVTAMPLAIGARAALGVLTPEGASVQVELRLSQRAPIELEIAEMVLGLPASARELVTRRNGPSTASQTGDVSLVSRRVRF